MTLAKQRCHRPGCRRLASGHEALEFATGPHRSSDVEQPRMLRPAPKRAELRVS